MNYKIKKVKKNQFKPDTALYILLLFIFLTFFLITFIILCNNLNNQKIIAITSALISISGGGIASVIVAWLIENSNCRKYNLELNSIKNITLMNFYFSFIMFLFTFKELANNNSKINVNEKHNWREWADLFQDLINENINKTDKEYLINNILKLEDNIEELNKNRQIIVSQKVLTNNEMIQLLEIKTDLMTLKIAVNKDDKKLFNGILDELFLHISKAESISQINDIEYNNLEILYFNTLK